jgi:putative heme transporter
MPRDPQGSSALARPSARALALLGAGAVAAVSVLYLLVPRLAGLDDTWGRLRDGDPAWIALAAALEVASFAGYATLLRVVTGVGRRASWSITLAGVAATRLFAAAGAGGIALTAWALRRTGLPRRVVLVRLSTFFAVLYGVFMAAVVIGGVGLRAGWFPGEAPFAFTVVPAVFAATVIAAGLLVALVPRDLDRRLGRRSAAVPAAMAAGVRRALALVRAREPGLLGAVAWWGCDILVLWASLHAFGAEPAAAVVTMAYFVGQLGNTLPIPGGVGGVEGALVAALVAFGEPAGLAIAGVLTYRALAFWLPTVPGVVAYVRMQPGAHRHADGGAPHG